MSSLEKAAVAYVEARESFTFTYDRTTERVALDDAWAVLVEEVARLRGDRKP